MADDTFAIQDIQDIPSPRVIVNHQKLAAAAAELASAVAAWERVDLSAERHVELDQQGLTIADNQEKSAEGREALKAVLQGFKAVPSEERPAKLGGVIKAFQTEVDALMRRQSSAEAAFLSLYRSLDDAPDPLPALKLAQSELEQHGSLATEAESLRQQLADYDKEFSTLKNQDATIRKLQKQAADAEARSEAAALDAAGAALAEREAAWENELSAQRQSAAEVEALLTSKLKKAEEEARRAQRSHTDAQEALFEQRTQFEQVQAAASAEIEQLRIDGEREGSRYLALEKEHTALQAKLKEAGLDGGGGSGGTSAEAAAEEAKAAQASVTRLEELLASRELQLARTSAELSATERHAQAAGERASAAASAHAAEMSRVQEELSARPTIAAHQALNEEVQTLRAKVAGGGGGGAGGGGGGGDEESSDAPHAAELLAAAGSTSSGASSAARQSMEALHAANTQRLQAELSVAKSQVIALERDLDGARAVEARTNQQLTEQSAAIAQLEDQLLHLQQQQSAKKGGGGGGGGECATPRAPPSCSSAGAVALSAVLTPADGAKACGGALGGSSSNPGAPEDELSDDALRLVVVQRERARRHAEELEAENRRHRDQCKAQQSEIRKLHADNLRLYEKARYLESSQASGGGAAACSASKPTQPVGRNSIAEDSTEGRYSKAYEEKVNPFAAFHRRERQQRYDGLNPAEKVVLNFAKFVAANKHARYFLIGYIICMHLLVSGAMYAASHHC